MPRRRQMLNQKFIQADALETNSVPDSKDEEQEELRTAGHCLSHLCLSEHLSDISFVFKGSETVKLPAHKLLLSMRSTVFEAMFYGPLAEKGDTVLIEDADPDTMKVLLRFIYTDESDLNGKNVLRCLYASKKYALPGLVRQCSSFLESSVDAENVCAIHEQAVFYDIEKLQKKCFDFIQNNASKVFLSQGFLEVSNATLEKLLKSDKLSAEEEAIFEASVKWAKHQAAVNNLDPSVENIRKALGDALYQIRFPAMPIDKFATVVTPTGFLSSDEQLMLYQYLATNGSTTVTKFVTRKRTGIIIVDVSNYTQGPSQMGFFLELRKMQNLFGVRGGGVAFKSPNQERCTSVASVCALFAPIVNRVSIQSGGVVRNIMYTSEGNEIRFQTPISVTDSNGCVIQFHTTETAVASAFAMAISGGSERTVVVNTGGQIDGVDVCLIRVPLGLTNISFVK